MIEVHTLPKPKVALLPKVEVPTLPKLELAHLPKIEVPTLSKLEVPTLLKPELAHLPSIDVPTLLPFCPRLRVDPVRTRKSLFEQKVAGMKENCPRKILLEQTSPVQTELSASTTQRSRQTRHQTPPPPPRRPVRERLGPEEQEDFDPQTTTKPNVFQQFITLDYLNNRIQAIHSDNPSRRFALDRIETNPISPHLKVMPIPDNFHMPMLYQYAGFTGPLTHVRHFKAVIGLYSKLDHMLYRLFNMSLKEEPLSCYSLIRIFYRIILAGRLHEYIIDAQKFLEEETKRKEVEQEQDQGQAQHLYMIEIEKGKKRKKDDRITSCCKMTSSKKSTKLLSSFSKANRLYHISFEDCGTSHVKYPHDNPLVIILKVRHDYLRTLLVDTGSGADVLFKRAVDILGLKDSVKALTTNITGFNGSKESALREIILPV
ncbi:hypothetical protein GIB67_025181 [Kingdonia uniflora]|uniref:Uncharacterized protein n=1 Tax=Kingdonia uniflora TaxID=39325 RepID=A0A7J7N856_9MAGN|nr:hypothetical protein GIB67_025181 [Kingdonia uniflora]